MVIIIFILGLIVGSFLNAYIWRLKTGKSVWRGRSCCPKCGKTLVWYELIPLLSFIIQNGRCRGCKQKIDWQYPLVELVTGILFILSYWKLGNWELIGNWKLEIGNFTMYCYFIAVLIILFVYDLRYGLIPNKVVIPAIVVSFLLNILLPELVEGPSTHFVRSGNISLMAGGYLLLAILIGAGFFAIQYYVSRGHWVGAGDIYFGALMGAMLGWPQVIVGLVVSYMLGGLVACLLLLFGKKKFGQTLPMGTFLAIGTIITLLWGRQILNWYWPL
ncbi:MAG: prepilin peptidase [bacterium]|nr:prepilin peptidase [bacterium]